MEFCNIFTAILLPQTSKNLKASLITDRPPVKAVIGHKLFFNYNLKKIQIV